MRLDFIKRLGVYHPHQIIQAISKGSNKSRTLKIIGAPTSNYKLMVIEINDGFCKRK